VSLNQLTEWCDLGRGRYRLELERGSDGSMGFRCEVWLGRVHEIGAGPTPEDAAARAVAKADRELARWTDLLGTAAPRYATAI
jgi:dsRNA-specific ribonuclease